MFPCDPGTYDGSTMTCYTHAGQHGSCSSDWYAGTKAAKPDEYADLMAELQAPPYGYRLKVYRRMTRDHRRRFLAQLHRCRISTHADPENPAVQPAGAPAATPTRKNTAGAAGGRGSGAAP